MIKAVIFDCFGVLTTDGWLPFKQARLGHDRSRQLRATDLSKQSDAGLISYDDFLRGVAKLAGVPLATAKQAIESNVANDELFAYIEVLKPSYKIGILSNASANFLPDLFSQQQLALIDAVSLSFESKVLKPDAQAYEIIAEKLGVEPHECVFIDDLERSCTGAREAGMVAVHYKNAPQAIAAVDALLQR